MKKLFLFLLFLFTFFGLAQQSPVFAQECVYNRTYAQDCCADGWRELVDEYAWDDGSGAT